MNQTSEIIHLSVNDLKISRLHDEIFGGFQRDYQALYKIVRSKGFDPEYKLQVRKIKDGYEVLCGVGYLLVLQRLDAETRYSDRAPSVVPCRAIDVTDREAARLILEESFDGCISLTEFTEFQLYLIGSLLDSFSHHREAAPLVKNKLHIGETTLKSFRAAYKKIMQRLPELYPEFAADLQRRSAASEVGEKLAPIRMINHALEKNEWLDLIDLFNGKLAISVFYKKHCATGLKHSASKGAGS